MCVPHFSRRDVTDKICNITYYVRWLVVASASAMDKACANNIILGGIGANDDNREFALCVGCRRISEGKEKTTAVADEHRRVCYE